MRYRRRFRRKLLSPAKQAMLAERDQLMFKVRLITSGIVKSLDYGLDEVHEFDTCLKELLKARNMYERARFLNHQIYENPKTKTKVVTKAK